MKAVYEELNGEMAVFVLDDVKKKYELPLSELPKDAEIGDLYAVEVSDKQLILLEKLPSEREDRLTSNQAKREQLLKRKKNLP